METIAVPRELLGKLVSDMEILATDVEELLSTDKIVKKRIADITISPSIGKSELELDEYLKQRGVKVD